MADLYTGSIGNLDSGATGMVGIGTSDPAGALQVNGEFITNDPWFDVRAFGAVGDGVTNDKRAIQNAIDAAALAGGGTVLIPGGVYVLGVIGGIATGWDSPTTGGDGTGPSFIDASKGNNTDFINLDIRAGDVVLNITKQTAGIVSSITPNTINLTQINYGTKDLSGNLIQHYLVGNQDCDRGTKPYFEEGDWYCFPGIVMKPGVRLVGLAASQQGALSSVLAFQPISSGSNSFLGPITGISVDPRQIGTNFALQNLTIQRAGDLYDGQISGDVGIDCYNHAGEQNSTGNWGAYPPNATIDNICICETYTGYQFGTGLRVSSFSGQVTNSSVCGCQIGIDLSFPFGETNSINLVNNQIWAGGIEKYAGQIGVRIAGVNNRIIGGCISTGGYNATYAAEVTLIKLQNSQQNNIIGVYFDGLGTECTGVSLDSNSYGNIISGCHFDTAFLPLPTASPTNTLFAEDLNVRGQNTFLSNGSDESLQNLPSNIAGQLGIPYPAVFNSQNANIGPTNFDPTILQNTGTMLTGWNRSGFGGEADFIANRGLGSIGGFAFYDIDNTAGAEAVQLVSIMGNGNMGIGTTSPQALMDIMPTVPVRSTVEYTTLGEAGGINDGVPSGNYTGAASSITYTITTGAPNPSIEISSISASSGTTPSVVVQTLSNNGLQNNQWIRISGDQNYNGDYVVTNVTETTFSIAQSYVGEASTSATFVAADTFTWNDGGPESSPVSITVGLSPLSNGVYFSFGNIVGHPEGCSWTFTVSVPASFPNPLRITDYQGNPQLTVQNNGYVGIGTTAPNSKVHVEIGSTGTAAISQPADAYGVFVPAVQGTGRFQGVLGIGESENQITCAIGTYDDGDDGSQSLWFGTGDNVNGLSEKMRILSGGYIGIGTTAPSTLVSLSETLTLQGYQPADQFVAGITLEPGYSSTKAATVPRHNYLTLNNPEVSSVAVTDAAVMCFNAVAGTHKAVDSGTTKVTPGTVNAWIKVNIAGTIYYMPAYTSKS